VLFVPGTVPVTGLVGADVAGELTGEVGAGSFAVVPISAQPASANSAPATGIAKDSFLIIVASPSIFWNFGDEGGVRRVQRDFRPRSRDAVAGAACHRRRAVGEAGL